MFTRIELVRIFLSVCVVICTASLSADFVPPTCDGRGIQQAIDAAAAAGGGRVVLKPTCYPSGTLYLKSNVELHVPQGAVIRGYDTPEKYDDVDDPRIGKRPENSKKVFIACFDVTNVAITGAGIIDGQGPAFYDRNIPPGRNFYFKPPHPRPRMIQMYKCRNVRFAGITLKDSPGWTAWIRNCEDVVADGVNVIGDQKMINNDGFHFDGCKRMRVVNSEFHTGDDAIVFRAIQAPDGNAYDEVGEDLWVANCVLDSACQGVRVGCPSDGLVRHAVFTNCTFRGRNGIISVNPYRYLRPTAKAPTGYCKMEDILVVDCTMDLSGVPVRFRVDPGVTMRALGNITLRNVQMRGGAPIELVGTGDTPVRNVCFENVVGTIAADTPLVTKNAMHMDFRNFRVTAQPGPKSALVFTPGRTEIVLASQAAAVSAAAEELRAYLEASVLGKVALVQDFTPGAAGIVIGQPPRAGSAFHIHTSKERLFIDCTPNSAQSAIHSFLQRVAPTRFPGDEGIGMAPRLEALGIPEGFDVDEKTLF